MNKDLLAKLSDRRYLNALEEDSDEEELTIFRALLERVRGLSNLNEVIQNSGCEYIKTTSLLQEAEELLENDEVEEALDKVFEAIEKDPFNPECYIFCLERFTSGNGNSQYSISN